MIVSGTNDNDFRERLLRESGLNLSIAISAGHAAEENLKYGRKVCQSQTIAHIYRT